MPRIRVAAVSRVNIRIGYDRLVCPKRSSPWQSIGGDSRMRPLSNSAECPDVMDPERGSVGSGAVVALCRTVAGRVPVWKCHAGKESAAQRWWERCSWKSSGTAILCPVLSRSCTALVLTMTDSEAFVVFPRPCSRVCATAWQSSVFAWLRGRLVPLQGYQVRSGEIQRSSAERELSGAIRGLQVLPGSGDSCRPLPRSSAQLRCCSCAAALGVPRCLLPAKTQLPPYGGLRESELKCLRSHPTPLRFYPQALSGAPALS